MAFGKNPEDLKHVRPFGSGTIGQREAFRKNQEKAARASRSGGMYWQDQFRLPTDHARMGRFIAGVYPQLVSFDKTTAVEEVYEYFMYSEHYDAVKKRGIVCSAGPLRGTREAEPCLGCDRFFEESRERRAKKNRGDNSRGPSTISLRDQFAFNFYDYGLWVNIPRNSGGKTYANWIPVPNEDPRAATHESKWGNLVVWPLNNTYMTTLSGYSDNELSCDCATCGSQGSVIKYAKACANPECKHVVYDIRNTALTPHQREELNAKPYTCEKCGQTGYLEDVIYCAQCNTAGLQPKKANFFDVDLKLIAVPSGDNNQTNLQILNRSNPRPISLDPAVFAELQLFDMAKKFAPTPIARQRELFGIGGSDTDEEVQAPYQQPAYQPATQAQRDLQYGGQVHQPLPQQGYQQPAYGVPALGSVPQQQMMPGMVGMPGMPGMQPGMAAPPTLGGPAIPTLGGPPMAPQVANNMAGFPGMPGVKTPGR